MRGARREKPGEITLPKRRNACPQSSAYTGRHLLKNGDRQGFRGLIRLTLATSN